MQLPRAILATVDAALDAAAVVDIDLRLVHFNRAYAALAGVRERELARRQVVGACHELFQLETCGEGGCFARRALAQRRPFRLDEVRSQRDGARLVVTAVPLLDEAGVPQAVVETYRDVTAESRMQDSYKELLQRERRRNEILQEEVRKRTEDLTRSLEELRATRAQLIHSEKMSSLGQLVAGIAHELNNPINYIYGNMDFLEEYMDKFVSVVDSIVAMDLPPDSRRVFEQISAELDLPFVRGDVRQLIAAIRSGAERVAAIVSDLRTFSHSGHAELREHDVNEGVVTTVNLLMPQAKNRVTIVKELDALPRVRCNGAHINQVVMNLVANAIQAITDKGTVVVRTRATETHVILEVRDDGCGIPPEHKDRIFDPFFTTKEVGKGTGLGLSITYGIVTAHQGRLEVESAPLRGTTFRVHLPIAGPAERGGVSHAPPPARAASP